MIRFPSRSWTVAVACIVLPCAAVVAQIESAPAEKPVAENPPRKLPDSLPAKPTPTPAVRTPDEVVAKFFENLKADRVNAAYDELDADFAVAEPGNEAQRMRDQTQKALDAYGPVRGYELILDEKLGSNLMRRTYLLQGESLPLRWRFYFYNAGDRWRLIDLRVDDALATWFDESKE